jgi:glycosyltransferase involved in cell wall biosynthesis
MLFNSGIGVYLRNLLPRVIGKSELRFALLGRPADFARSPWVDHPHITLLPTISPIYSIAQQLELPRLIPHNTALYWAPHYDVPLLHKGKLLVTIHDVAHVAMPEIFSGVLKQGYARSMLQLVRRTAAHIMFVSAFSHWEFERLVGRPTGTTSIEHLGIDESWRDPRWGSLPSMRDGPYIVYVGNVKPHKNLAGLLAAFDLIQDRIEHDLLLIGQIDGFLTGDSAVAERLRKKSSRIVFTGPLSDTEVRTLVAKAAILVLPSFYEGFGLPPLEAMACGCPVAAARSASIPEICGDAVLYFDPHEPADIANSILRIVESPAMADELRRKGLIKSGEYLWEDSALRVSDVINRLARS